MAPTAADTDRLRSLATELRDFVLRAKRALDEEMRTYPTPIPRCDAQFNHAYEQRARLAALLRRIDAAGDGSGRCERAHGRDGREFASLPSMDESVDERTPARTHRGRAGAAPADATVEAQSPAPPRSRPERRRVVLRAKWLGMDRDASRESHTFLVQTRTASSSR